jgi:hypothetical protein
MLGMLGDRTWIGVGNGVASLGRLVLRIELCQDDG